MLKHTPPVLLPLMAGRAFSVAMLSIDSVLRTAASLTDDRQMDCKRLCSNCDLPKIALQDNVATVRRSF